MTEPKVEPLWAGELTSHGWRITGEQAWLVTGAGDNDHALQLACAHLVGEVSFWVAFDAVHVFDDTGTFRRQLRFPQPGWWRKVPVNGKPEGFHWRLVKAGTDISGAFKGHLIEAA